MKNKLFLFGLLILFLGIILLPKKLTKKVENDCHLKKIPGEFYVEFSDNTSYHTAQQEVKEFALVVNPGPDDRTHAHFKPFVSGISSLSPQIVKDNISKYSEVERPNAFTIKKGEHAGKTYLSTEFLFDTTYDRVKKIFENEHIKMTFFSRVSILGIRVPDGKDEVFTKPLRQLKSVKNVSQKTACFDSQNNRCNCPGSD